MVAYIQSDRNKRQEEFLLILKVWKVSRHFGFISLKGRGHQEVETGSQKNLRLRILLGHRQFNLGDPHLGPLDHPKKVHGVSLRLYPSNIRSETPCGGIQYVYTCTISLWQSIKLGSHSTILQSRYKKFTNFNTIKSQYKTLIVPEHTNNMCKCLPLNVCYL